jgi:hypothetical protein
MLIDNSDVLASLRSDHDGLERVIAMRGMLNNTTTGKALGVFVNNHGVTNDTSRPTHTHLVHCY